jgi:glycosyltransferase involved in cell wall biosynthesis
VAREAGAIAQAVRALLAEQLPQARVRAAAERFTWERNAAQLHRVYAEVVSRQNPSSTSA